MPLSASSCATLISDVLNWKISTPVNLALWNVKG